MRTWSPKGCCVLLGPNMPGKDGTSPSTVLAPGVVGPKGVASFDGLTLAPGDCTAAIEVPAITVFVGTVTGCAAAAALEFHIRFTSSGMPVSGRRMICEKTEQTLPLDEGEAARDANADSAEYSDRHMMIASHGSEDNEEVRMSW
ncbi:hypothetical protein KC361_g80 [Hortaea werneckii]|nr:hypothetical protein KC361_g80 [Hortaea werneckii]